MSDLWRRYLVSNSARALGDLLDRDPDDPRFDMEQPYQRGVVWGRKRKRNLIKSLLMGVPVPAIVINDRFAAKFSHPGYDRERNWMYAVVDGKQRLSAIQGFVRDEFYIPADWVEDDPDEVLRGVYFSQLPIGYQRGFRCIAVPVAEGRFKTLDEERELFDLINFGGLAQGEIDDDLIVVNQ